MVILKNLDHKNISSGQKIVDLHLDQAEKVCQIIKLQELVM